VAAVVAAALVKLGRWSAFVPRQDLDGAAALADVVYQGEIVLQSLIRGTDGPVSRRAQFKSALGQSARRSGDGDCQQSGRLEPRQHAGVIGQQLPLGRASPVPGVDEVQGRVLGDEQWLGARMLRHW